MFTNGMRPTNGADTVYVSFLFSSLPQTPSAALIYSTIHSYPDLLSLHRLLNSSIITLRLTLSILSLYFTSVLSELLTAEKKKITKSFDDAQVRYVIRDPGPRFQIFILDSCSIFITNSTAL